MQDIDLNKAARASLAAFVLGGSLLVNAASSVAADLGPYITHEEAILERPPARRRIVVEENYSAPPIERHVIERRVFERRVVEGYEGPVLVPPQYPPMIPVQESEDYEGPALVPPQYVPVVPLQPFMRPHLHRQRIVHVPAPAGECRIVVMKQSDAFGDVIVHRTHTCD